VSRQYDKGPIFITPMKRGDYRAECHACADGWWNDFTTEVQAKDAADAHLVNKHRKPKRRRAA
jgi:hypothetical protein